MNNLDKPLVVVLMSTYNGGFFLEEQLDSIFRQNGVKVHVVVRDDGSTDNTLDIISKYDDITVFKGNNIGCEPSFMKLLHIDIVSDYYAFADQDDIWLPDKLISAIHNMEMSQSEIAACNLHLIDSTGNSIRDLFTEVEILDQMNSMKKYILCNKHGCVLVWSRKLHEIIQSYYPKCNVAHDMWVNAIGNIVSNTFISSIPYILYRQHENNTAGYAMDYFSRFKKGFLVYLGKNHPHRDLLAQELLTGFIDYLNDRPTQKELLVLISNYKCSLIKKIQLCFSDFISNDDFSHKLLWRLCILLNRY